MHTIQSELDQFIKTGNSSHARWVANELIKILDESHLKSIQQNHDVTVGWASNGDIKSALLWASLSLSEAKNKLLTQELNEEKKEANIMREALQEIRMRGRREPFAGEIAATALNKVQSVNG